MLGWNQNLLETVGAIALRRLLANRLRDLLLEVRIGVNDVPAHAHGGALSSKLLRLLPNPQHEPNAHPQHPIHDDEKQARGSTIKITRHW